MVATDSVWNSVVILVDEKLQNLHTGTEILVQPAPTLLPQTAGKQRQRTLHTPSVHFAYHNSHLVELGWPNIKNESVQDTKTGHVQ